MPRITFKQYLDQRAFLKLAWEEFDQLYSLLSTNQQWDLHAYYQPLHNYDADWLRAHRERISRTQPTLPAKAGRSFARMRRVYAAGMAVLQRSADRPTPTDAPKPPASSEQSRTTVRAIARPEPDLHALSLALIALNVERTSDRRLR